jgi:hypothetical protein
MSVNNRKNRARSIITVVGCSLLIVISLVTFQQQIPTISERTRIYDKEYINALRRIGDIIPQNETLAATENYPQVTYFTDHKVKVPWVYSERSLVEFMWKINSSHLLVPEPVRKPDNTPLLIQLAEKPFEIFFDYYDEYISELKAGNTVPFNTSEPKSDNTPLQLEEVTLSRSTLFKKLFEKIWDYNTEDSILHLYRVRSNITRDNLSIVTDNTKPMLFLSTPINGTVLESKFGVLRINVTGTAIDADSNIKKVEISVNGLPWQIANPRAPDDWSTWSFSDLVTSEGTKRIGVKATDNADNKRWLNAYMTIK